MIEPRVLTQTAATVGAPDPGAPPRSLLQPPVDGLAGRRVGFAGNAWSGRGGQGEFLRQMIFALAHLPQAAIFSRGATAMAGRSVDLPLVGFPWRQLFAVASAPVVRRRVDWLTLLSDVQFDRQVARHAGGLDLFDGVMAQCSHTFGALKGQGAALVLTSLNTHVDHLARVLDEEHRAVGYRGPHVVNPRMRLRAIREIGMADRIRVNSAYAKDTFVERGVPAAHVHVIQPAIDLAHFRPVAPAGDVFRVLAVASVTPRKGIHYLLQAFEAAKIPRSELVLIGGTGDRWSKDMLESFRRRHAHITVSSLDVTTAPAEQSYGAASVLVHPAIEDGYGLVIPQALACGRPVIATRQSGASELIRDGENGFVVESRSVDALRERLQLLATDRNLRERMGACAPAAVSHLSYDGFRCELLRFYRGVLDGRPRA